MPRSDALRLAHPESWGVVPRARRGARPIAGPARATRLTSPWWRTPDSAAGPPGLRRCGSSATD